MPALNFFRLYQNQKSNLLKLLEEKGIRHLQLTKTTYGGDEFSLSLYFSVSPKKSYVKWIKHFGITHPRWKQNRAASVDRA